MAVAEDFDTSTLGAHDWLGRANAGMHVVVGALTEAPFAPAIEALNRFRDELNAAEALIIAQRQQAGHSDRSTEGIIKQSGGVSKNEAKKRTKRAAAVSNNPGLATGLTSGKLSTEQVDLLADASAKTGGEAATDAELITKIGNANPDQGKAIARRYVDEHQDQGSRDSRYAWQRKRRKAYKGRGTNGLAQIIIEGDDISVEGAILALRRRADAMYRADGGRDVANGSHPRTHDQRMFDAAIEQIMGDGPPMPGVTITVSTPDAAASTSQASPSTDSAAAPEPPPKAPRNRPGERPTMVFVGKLSEISNDPQTLEAWSVELVGSGIVPSPVASYYRCISDHTAQLISDTGAVLWQGRAVRRVTPQQWIALVVRDGGCVYCDSHHTMCEAHHLVPWSAPAKGETNIDEMILVCEDCHHRIHDNNQTAFFDEASNSWKLRPATWAETPPKQRRPGKPKPGRSPAVSESRPESATPPDPYSRETKYGTLRHDIFDWAK